MKGVMGEVLVIHDPLLDRVLALENEVRGQGFYFCLAVRADLRLECGGGRSQY